MNQENGQIVMIMLLVMVIALAIGLSIIGHSITDVSTSSRTESSARALSAAEAGIEKALASNQIIGSFNLSGTLSNLSTATTNWNGLLPMWGLALEYPPFGKESFAQFWLVDPSINNIQSYYTRDNFNLYFGTPRDYSGDDENKPAVEVHVVLKSGSGVGSNYYSKKYYYDSYFVGANTTRNLNGFNKCSGSNLGITAFVNENRVGSYYCQVRVPPSGSYLNAQNDFPVLVRVRILYSNYSHPVALQPSGSGFGAILPTQASIYTSKGESGNTQRELQLFKARNVVPYLFDYVLFSASSLQK